MKYQAMTCDSKWAVVDDHGGLLYEWCEGREEAELLALAYNRGAEAYEDALRMFPALERWAQPQADIVSLLGSVDAEALNMAELWQIMTRLGQRWLVYLTYDAGAARHVCRIADGYDIQKGHLYIKVCAETPEHAMRSALAAFADKQAQ